MLRVGLTGGLASGKSYVAGLLAEMGCHRINADELGHQALLPGGGAYQGAIREFGEGILEEDGTIGRRRLAALVFSDPEKLSRLNALVHPVVIRREDELMQEAARLDPEGIAVVEAAIMIEAGTYRRFDKLVLAVCRPEQQIERAMERGHLSREEVLARLARQMPLEEKRRYADYVIDTSGTKEETLEQTRRLYLALQSHRER